MDYLVDMAFLALAVALIGKGADWFAEAAVRIAEATHVPKAIIGATIVSVATTLPEFSVSAIATVGNHTDMAIGNAVGSAICNIGLILGLCTLARASVNDRALVRRQGGVMLGAALLVLLLSSSGQLGREAGSLLVAGLVAYMLWSVKTARERRRGALDAKARREADGDGDEPVTLASLQRHIGEFVVGAVFVILGSRLLVSTGVELAELAGVPELVISLTVVALGTSLPELVTAVTATIKGHQEMAVANVMGANIMNLLWVLGGCALIRPLPLNPSPSFAGFPQTLSLDMPVMLLLMVLLVTFAYSEGTLRRREGGALLAIYVVYLIGLFAVIRP